MKTIEEIRRNNLLTAIEIAGSAVKLSELAGVSSAYISQIKSQAPESKTGKPKSMGDVVARKIEAALGMPHGWMDSATHVPNQQNPEDSNIPEAPHPEHIQAVIELMYSVDERGMRKIRDAAEDAIDRYRALQKELGVEIKPTSKKTIKSTETAQSNVASQHHFEGSQQNFNTGSIGGVTGRGNIVNQYSRNK